MLSNEKILKPTAYWDWKQKGENLIPKPYHWVPRTIDGILEKYEYLGHTVNFKTNRKSYKCKKRIMLPKEEWVIFENTHEPLVSQHDFDLVQEIRSRRRRIQMSGETNIFSGLVYCADCGRKMHVCRRKNERAEHFKCGRYSIDRSECSAHYIRTAVLEEVILKELNKLLDTVITDEESFIRSALDNSSQKHNDELKNARKHLTKSQKRIAELDKLFTRIYEDNVSGKLSDERFETMSKSYETEQKQLKNTVSELSAFIETKEQKSADVSQFVGVIKKYEHIDKLTSEIMHELIERIEIHAPDKSDGHRKQQIDIYYRFNVATAMVIADRREYTKKRKAA